MTVLNAENPLQISTPAEGSTSLGPWSTVFSAYEAADVVVMVRESDGTVTVLSTGDDYSLTGVGTDPKTYNITLTALPLGWSSWPGDADLIRIRATDLSQLYDLNPSLAVNQTALKRALDRVTRITQEHARDIGRAAVAPLGEAGPGIAALADRKGRFLYADADTGDIAAGPTVADFNSDVSATADHAASAQADAAAAATAAATALSAAGLYRSMETVSERDAIPAAQRTSGMIVTITADEDDANNIQWMYTGASGTSDNDLWTDEVARFIGLRPGGDGAATLTVAAWAGRIVYLNDFLHPTETLYDNAFDRAVAFVQALGGGTIRGAPGAVYSFGGAHVIPSGARVDCDFCDCTLNITSTNLLTFDLQAAFSEFRNARIVNGAAQVAGSNYIKLSATAAKAINNDIYGDYLGIYSTGTIAQVLFNRFYAAANGATRIWIAGGDCSQLVFGNVGNYIAGSTPAYGIKLTHATATILSHNSMIGQGVDCAIMPGVGESSYSVKLAHNFFDTAGGGLLVKTVAGSSVNRLRIIDLWASSHTTSGIVLDSSAGGTIDDTSINSAETGINAAYGISLLGAGTTHTDIINGGASQNATAALHVGAGVGSFTVSNWKARATGELSDNGKAVILEGSNTNYTFDNCVLGSSSGHGVTGHVQTQTEIIRDCDNYVTKNFSEPTLMTDAFGQAFWNHGLAATPAFANVQGPLSYDDIVAKVIAVTSTQVEIFLFHSTTGAALASTSKTVFIEARL